MLKIQLGFTEKERTPLTYLIDELTNNINDHSFAEYGSIFAQFYPSKKYLDVCICDLGIGILKSYLNNGEYLNSHAEAIKLAISGVSTKDRPEARGFGISTSLEMLVNGLNGRFFLWSGDALL